MTTALALITGCLVAGGIYLMMSTHLVRILFGLVMLSNAVNLMIFTAGGLTHRQPALIAPDQTTITGPVANALPQALILTAIVIGFALLTFMFVLFYRSHAMLGTADTRLYTEADEDQDPERPSGDEEAK